MQTGHLSGDLQLLSRNGWLEFGKNGGWKVVNMGVIHIEVLKTTEKSELRRRSYRMQEEG